MFSGPSQWKTFMWNLWRNDGGETVHLTGEVVTVDPVLSCAVQTVYIVCDLIKY